MKFKMNKKILAISLGIILLLGIGIFILNNSQNNTTSELRGSRKTVKIFPSSFNPENTDEIGYEFLDNGDVIHIWNTQDNYFFDVDSGIQLTNHYQDYWTRNIFCLGYYNSNEWNKINCADELINFNKEINTNNLSYVNATLWKDIEYNGYDIRLGVQYSLGLNDKNLSITVYGKNLGIDIPYDLGFAWKITDWEIPHDSVGGDSIFINKTDYNLNGTFNITFEDMQHSYIDFETNETIVEYDSYLRGYDWTEFLKIDWNKDLNYKTKIFGNGNQEDFYVMIMINAGHFNPQQEKQTTFNWIDAEGTYTGLHWTPGGTFTTGLTTDGTNIYSISYVTEIVYKYDMDGASVSNWAAGTSTEVAGITTNGTDLWVLDWSAATDYAERYNITGTYLSNFDVTDKGSAGMCNNGTDIFAVDSDGNLYRYLMNGTYKDSWAFNTTEGNTAAKGCTTDGNFIWIVDDTTQQVYKYYTNGTFTDINWSISEVGANNGEDITQDGIYFWVVDQSQNEIYKYLFTETTPSINIEFPTNNTLSSDINLDVNYTASDVTLESCWYSNDTYSINTSLADCTTNITTVIWSEGKHNVTVWANNSDGNENNSKISFTIDSAVPTININYPTDGIASTNNNLDINYTASDANLESCWYSNGTYTVNTTLASCTTNITTVIWADGLENVTVWVNDTSGNQKSASVTFTIDTINPNISIAFPTNNTNSTNANLNINYIASDETGLFNCWYSNDTYAANTTLASCTTNITTVTWTEGYHNVTVWANDTSGNLNNSKVSFYVDSIVPVVNVTYPIDFIDYKRTGTNLTINWTVSDTYLDSCLGSFDGGTNNVSLTCANVNITRNITSANNNSFTFWANDSIGNVGNITRDWIYRIFENKQTYSASALSGSTQTFVNNISLGAGETISGVVFSYNGTDRATVVDSLGGTEYNLSSTFAITQVLTATNISFYWKITLLSGVVNTIVNKQLVNVIDIDDCSSYSTLVFNYTLIDEEHQTNSTTNPVIDFSINLYDSTKTTLVTNFSQNYTNTSRATVCMNFNLTSEASYTIDSTVRYSADNHSTEYYNIQNFQLTNATIPQAITLYDLLTEDATEFQITFKDENFVAVEDALIQVNRQYIPEGIFKTVEIPKTDANGQTVVHLVEKDVVYNFIVLKEGEILGTFTNIIAFCEDVLTGSCFISLNALTAGVEAYNYDEVIGLHYSFEYNETSRNLSFDFTTVDGSVKNVTLSGIKIDVLGETEVCSGVLISAGGSILCSIPISVGNETIIVEIFVDGDLQISNHISAGTSFDIGDAGYFLLFFLVLSLALMMTQSKQGVIIGVVIGFIAGSLLSFIKGGVIGIGSSIIWLVIMAVILLYKMSQEKGG